MFNQVLCFYYEVINMVYHLLVQHITKDRNHGSLIGITSILQSEKHHLVIVIPKKCPKGGFLGICWLHDDLVVTNVAIHERKTLVTNSCVHQNVDIR